MALWSVFMADVRPKVPGCADIIIEHELRRASQEFMRRTRAWRVRLPAAAVAADQASVPIVMADNQQELVRVESAFLDSKTLTLATVDDIAVDESDDWQDDAGSPDRYLRLVPGAVRLYPKPAAAASTGLVLDVSVRPSEVATGLPDDLVTEYREAIIAGAIARLAAYNRRAWTDPVLAAEKRMEFEDAVAIACNRVARGFGRGRVPSRAGWC